MRLTPQQALERLQPQGKRRAKGLKAMELIDTIGVAEDDIYVFGNSDGGIVAPAYDTLPYILGTWEDGGDDMPPALREWLEGYAEEVVWWERIGEGMNQDEPTPTKVKAAPRQTIPMMLQTKWSQSSPYNDMIIFDGKRCVTGCNATAAAQIIYHWGCKGYHRGCLATEAYKTATNKWDVDALPSKMVWDYPHMVIKPKTDAEKKAVQELMVWLGRTFLSDYTPASTNASARYVASCMRDKLRMGDNVSYIYASKIGESAFEAKIYNEMVNGRPTMIAGWKASGGGHTFVADGYDASQDMYHINWGWGGSCDGWFRMSALNPTSSRAYNTTKTAIIGIKPDLLGDVNGDGKVDITDAMKVVQAIEDGDNDARYDINNDGKPTITDVQLIIDKILGRIDL